MNRPHALLSPLLLALTAGPALAQAPQQKVSPPEAQAWIDLATYSGFGIPGMGWRVADAAAATNTTRVERTSDVQVHHDVARFAWHVVLADGSTLPEGLDLAIFNDSGKITRIDVYLQMALPDPEMLASYSDVEISD